MSDTWSPTEFSRTLRWHAPDIRNLAVAIMREAEQRDFRDDEEAYRFAYWVEDLLKQFDAGRTGIIETLMKQNSELLSMLPTTSHVTPNPER